MSLFAKKCDDDDGGGDDDDDDADDGDQRDSLLTPLLSIVMRHHSLDVVDLLISIDTRMYRLVGMPHTIKRCPC